MIGRGYESRDPAAGSSRNASPTSHPRPTPFLRARHLERPSVSANPSTPRNTTVTSILPTTLLPLLSHPFLPFHPSLTDRPPPSWPPPPPPPPWWVVVADVSVALIHEGITYVVSLQSFLFLQGGREGGGRVLNGVVATLLLATKQVSSRL